MSSVQSTEQLVHFNEAGFLMTDVPIHLLETIDKEINEIKSNFSLATKYNHTLAGNLEHEYELTKSNEDLNTFVLSLADVYNKRFEYFKTIRYIPDGMKFGLLNSWVNFQQKYEFNPPHIHDGILSFVIWLKVPYLIEDEFKNPSCINSNTKLPGHFYLLYSSYLGDIRVHPIPADKTYEGKILMFPAAMNHGVHPFYTSDEYRISVSGNLGVKV